MGTGVVEPQRSIEVWKLHTYIYVWSTREEGWKGENVRNDLEDKWLKNKCPVHRSGISGVTRNRMLQSTI